MASSHQPLDPRRRLHHEDVVAAAETLVDREGWQHLTMAALAAELGVKAPSLYNHVPSLDALRGELQQRTLRAIGAVLNRKAMGRAGEPAMRALAQAFRRYANEHPGLYDLAMQAPVDPAGFAAAAADAGLALTAVIRSYGIEDPSFELQLAAFAALHGVLVLEHTGFFPPMVDPDRVFAIVLDLTLGLFERAAGAQEQAS